MKCLPYILLHNNRAMGARLIALLAMGAVTLCQPQWAAATNGDIQAAIQTEVASKFSEGKSAYDDNRMDDAIRAYEGIAELGYESEVLYYNLANAFFKKGRIGPAVLNYRRAQYTTHRDPDIRANLGYAFESAGIEAQASSLVARIGGILSLQEWVILGTVSFWGICLSLACLVWWKRTRVVSHRVGAALTALLAVSLTGTVYWLGLQRRPEVVVMRPNQHVLFAPLTGSTVHFAAPEGTVLRVEEADDGWLKVLSGKQGGWIEEKACERVWK